jgi:hypothetical protein
LILGEVITTRHATEAATGGSRKGTVCRQGRSPVDDERTETHLVGRRGRPATSSQLCEIEIPQIFKGQLTFALEKTDSILCRPPFIGIRPHWRVTPTEVVTRKVNP